MRRGEAHITAVSFMFALMQMVVFLPSTDAQSFRGEVVATRIVSDAAEAQFELEAGQVLLLGFTENYPYVDGVEIDVTPENGRPLPAGSFSLAVFEGIDRSVEHEEGFTTIAGRSLGTIPLQGSTSVTVPLTPGLQAANRTAQPRTSDSFLSADPGKGYIAAQIVPSMKGMNPAFEDTLFTVRITPRLSGKGGIRVSIHGEPGIVEQALNELELSLNGSVIQADRINTITPGIYRLTANAGQYLEHAENIGVEAGRTVTRTLLAQEPRASIRVRVPSVAEVFIDGVRIPGDTRSTVDLF